MLYSMTGFTRYTYSHSNLTATWEIRSVNSKYMDLKWRLPYFLRSAESDFEKALRKYAKRGKIEISLEIQYHNPEESTPLFLDKVQVNHMIEQISHLAKEHHVLFQPDYNRLLNMPALWINNEASNEAILQELLQSMNMALEDWNKSRQGEAKALEADLTSRLSLMEGWLKHIETKAPQIKEERLKQLRERLKNMLESLDMELQEQRFLQECVFLADKTDVSEEITRLSAHLKRMLQLIKSGTDAGRKIDFTLQEAFREINTLGNKVQDMELSPIVVDFKTELEKCREQAQNLE